MPTNVSILHGTAQCQSIAILKCTVYTVYVTQLNRKSWTHALSTLSPYQYYLTNL